jgi:hypothetical protein
VQTILVGNPERKKKYLTDLEVNGRIILQWILRKEGMRMWNGFIWLRNGSSEPWGSTKGREFLDWVERLLVLQ